MRILELLNMTQNAISSTPTQEPTAKTFQTRYGRYKDLCDALGLVLLYTLAME